MSDLHLFSLVSTVAAALAITLGTAVPAYAMERPSVKPWSFGHDNQNPRKLSPAPSLSGWR